MKQIAFVPSTLLAVAVLLWPLTPRAQSADSKNDPPPIPKQEKEPAQDEEVELKIVTDAGEHTRLLKDRVWLGVGVAEASEALGEQLGLEAGVGLVVTHVSPDSPAAKAGLKKNDVLTELAGHALVHPAQLRKLVQSRNAGDKMEMTFYRRGQKQTAAASLEKTPARLKLFDEESFDGNLRELHYKLIELPRIEALHESFRGMPGDLKRSIESGVKRGMEQAHKAIADASREVDRNQGSLRKEQTRLKELFKSGINIDDNATVVVRSKATSARSIVKTDQSGTIIIVGPPSLYLTARDKNGQTLFDGAIETPEQRDKVPPDLWKRVEPLLEEK